MNTCLFTPGLFVQHPCKRPASAICTRCAIALCDQHSTLAEDGQSYCPKCAPAQEYDNDHMDEYLIDRHHYGSWYWYVHSQHHRGASDEPLFVASDFESFDNEGTGEFDYAGGEDDFYDS